MTGVLRTIRTVTAVALYGVLPAYALSLIVASAAGSGKVTDFENAFYPAAEAILQGASPYPAPDDPQLALGTEYVYPPLIALVTVPFTAVPAETAALLATLLLVVGVLGTLWVLEVRDWRCYGLAFIWPPVISAIQTGNVTIPLTLGAAVIWRHRDHITVAGVSLGLTMAAKLFLWPLTLWLGLTRRIASALLAVVVGALSLLVTWAVIGFAGIGAYPDLLSRIQELEERDSYTLYALALDLGASQGLARALWIGLLLSLLAGVAVLAHRHDDQRAFILAVAAALACSPIVWLHYFALLLVVVAVAERRLGPAWFIPLAMYGSTAIGNGTTVQTALTIAVAAVTVSVAVRPTWRSRPVAVRATSPAGERS